MADYDPDALYNVEVVRDHKGHAPFRQFFIKWEDYDESTNTWEPEINLVYNEVAQTYCRDKGLPPIVDPAAEKERKRQERADKVAQRIKKEEEEGRLRKEKKRRRKEAGKRRLEEEAAAKHKLPAPPSTSRDATPRADSPEIPLDLSRQGRGSVTSQPVSSTTPPPAPLIVKLPVPRPRTVSVSSDSSVEFLGTSSSSKAGSTSASASKASSSSPEQHSKTDVWNRDSEDDESDEEDGRDLFAVRKVMEMKGLAPEREFHVQWEGYESEDDTWEPESGVGHLDIVRAFVARKQAEKDAKKKAEQKRKREISEAKEKASSKATSSTSGSSSVRKPVKASSDKLTALLQKDGKKAGTSSTSGFKVPKAKTQTKTPEELKAVWQKQLKLKDPEPVNTAAKTLHPLLSGYSPSFLLTPTAVPKPEVKTPVPVAVSVPVPTYRRSPEKPVRVFNIPTPEVEVYPEFLPDGAIKKEFPNEHFAMAKMVLGAKVHEPETKEESSRSGLPEDLDGVWRPPPEDRFVGLYNRLSFLRDKSSFFSGQQEPLPVTSSDHIFERAVPDLRQLDWNKGYRNPEVIGNYMEYFKNRLLPAHQHAMTWTSPPTMLRFTPREVPASLHNGLKDPDVMLHMGRDVMNYAKEKNRQRCSKQIVRPGRLRGPRRSGSHRR